MINKYPIMLYQVNFSGKGYDNRNFGGAVFYIRTSFDENVTLNGLNAQIKLVNAIIEEYVRKNLSSFDNLQVDTVIHLISSQIELGQKLKLYGREYGYDKRAFGFYVCPNLDSIYSNTIEAKQIDYTNVKINGLTVYTKATSEEMRQTLQSCFANEVFFYPIVEHWSEKHPILAKVTSTIKSIMNIDKPRTTMNRYFLAYEVPQDYVGAQEQELQFSNKVDDALEKVPGVAIDVVPFSRTLTFTVQRDDVTIQDIAETLLNEMPGMHFALFGIDDTESYIIK